MTNDVFAYVLSNGWYPLHKLEKGYTGMTVACLRDREVFPMKVGRGHNDELLLDDKAPPKGVEGWLFPAETLHEVAGFKVFLFLKGGECKLGMVGKNKEGGVTFDRKRPPPNILGWRIRQ